MSAYRILLFADHCSMALATLVGRLERELPSAKVCGIILDSRHAAQSGIKLGFIDHLLRFVHGSVATPASVDFEAATFVQECEQRGQPVLFAEQCGTERIAKFVRDQKVDLALVVADSAVPPTILSLPRQGSLRSKVEVSEAQHQDSIAIIEPAFDGSPSPRVVSVRLPVQPFDTPETTALIRDLLTNDVLIRSAAGFCAWQGGQAIQQVPIEVRFAVTGPENTGANWSDPSNWRLRPAWKLALHTLVLISPVIVIRNWYRRWRRQFPVVIMFHHLISNRPHRMGIPTQIFLDQIQFLRKHYRVASLSQAVEIMRSGVCRQPTVVITFDDGYMDNFVYLRAVTEATKVPVLLFVCTQVVERCAPFEHDLKKGEVGFPSLGWEQIRAWQSEGVEFGSHTRTHFNCGSTDAQLLAGEMRGSRDDMQERLGKPPRFFAFPWGQAKNMSREALDLSASLYEYSLSTLAFENFANRCSFSRLGGRKPWPASVWELELAIQSVFDLMSRLRNRSEGRESGGALS